jgi:ADP-ribosylglycohydrolase
MTGAIIGDYVGSAYEFQNTDNYDFQLITPESEITDDSVLTVAVADAILQGKSYKDKLLYWGNKYPHPKGGYGSSFDSWLHSSNPQPYNSFGNGAAMRVSAVGWAFETLQDTLIEAQRSAQFTHNHPEGIKGAQAVAAAIFLVRTGKNKEFVKQYIEKYIGYNLSRKLADIHQDYTFHEDCMKTVPEAIICYLESTSFEDAVRLAVSLGGDSDTLACIAGSIAEAEYGISLQLVEVAFKTVPDEMKTVVKQFCEKYNKQLIVNN